MPIPLPAGSADAKTHHIILEHNTQLDEQLPCCTNSPSCKLKVRSEEDNNFRYCILKLAHRSASELPVLEYGIMHCARISIQLYIMYVVLVCLLEYMYLYVLVRMWIKGTDALPIIIPVSQLNWTWAAITPLSKFAVCSIPLQLDYSPMKQHGRSPLNQALPNAARPTKRTGGRMKEPFFLFFFSLGGPHALCASRVAGLLDGYKLAWLRDDARNTVNKTKQNKKG